MLGDFGLPDKKDCRRFRLIFGELILEASKKGETPFLLKKTFIRKTVISGLGHNQMIK